MLSTSALAFAQLRHQLGMSDLDRAGFEIVGDVIEVLRHPAQRVFDLGLTGHACQPTRTLCLFAVVPGRMHIPSTQFPSC